MLYYKKDLFLLSHGSVFDSKYAGNNWLLANGARCINSEEDLIKNLIDLYPSKDFKACIETKLREIRDIPQEYQQIYAILTETPLHINFIAEKLGISLNELQSKLFMMELDNFATKVSSNQYIRGKG